jgi:hypothetical protein
LPPSQSYEHAVSGKMTLGTGDLVSAGRGAAARSKLLPVVEAVATGLAVSGGLCWAGAAALASFRPHLLGLPYWYEIPRLRTDTCGAIAFLGTAICLVIGKYLRLRRLAGAVAGPGSRPGPAGPGTRLIAAVSETAAILSAALVVYLSVNAVTHPQTLEIQATHFASWPTEGTLRVLALVVCAIAVGVLRYLRATSGVGR